MSTGVEKHGVENTYGDSLCYKRISDIALSDNELNCSMAGKRQQSATGGVINVPVKTDVTTMPFAMDCAESANASTVSLSSPGDTTLHDASCIASAMCRKNIFLDTDHERPKDQQNDQDVAQSNSSSQTATPATPCTPDLTLTLSNIPTGCTDKDIVSLLCPFIPENCTPHCAFNRVASTVNITLPSQESLDRALLYISSHGPQIRGVAVTVAKNPPKSAHVSKHASRDPLQESRVLFVTVTNMGRYPVGLDVLHRVFSRYGTVEKIILFPKPTGRCQSLIQLSNVNEARNALSNLNHRDIYDGCNTLQIDFSRLSDLVVNSNTSRSWDYLVAPRYSDVQSPHQPPYGIAVSAPVSCTPNAPFPPTRWPPNNGVMDPSMLQQHHLLKMREQNGLFQEPLQHMMPPHVMYHTIGGLSAEPLFKRLTPSIIEKLPPELQNMKMLRQINPKQTSVVICYNLPVGDITVVKLFNLFSIYGIVEKIKLLRGKESTALIQYSDPFFAALAFHFLEGAPFFGIEGGLQIEMSRNFEVKISPMNNGVNSAEAAEEAKRAGQFSLKDQRCTRDEIAKIVRGACRPTSTIFISNIPNTLDEDALREVISTVGVVHKLKLNNSGSVKKATAVAELASEKEAVAAICNLHNHRIARCHLKVAFTKQILANSK